MLFRSAPGRDGRNDPRVCRDRISQRQQTGGGPHGRVAGREVRSLGGHARVHRAEDYADNIQINFPGHEKIKPVLLLGHFDTVYPLGTLGSMPCRVDDGRLHGPGVLDMKSGIALMLYAIEALQAWYAGLRRPVTVFLVSDEEVGSYSSRQTTMALARESAAVLVLEPAGARRRENCAQGSGGIHPECERCGGPRRA